MATARTVPITGTLYDATGNPVNGATVTATLQITSGTQPIYTVSNYSLVPLVSTTTTNSAGVWTLNLVAPGDISPSGLSYEVVVPGFTGTTTSFTYTASTTPLSSILLAAPTSGELYTTIWDYLVGPSGLPIDGITVNAALTQSVTSLTTSASLDGSTPSVATSDERGYWSAQVVRCSTLDPLTATYAVSEGGGSLKVISTVPALFLGDWLSYEGGNVNTLLSVQPALSRIPYTESQVSDETPENQVFTHPPVAITDSLDRIRYTLGELLGGSAWDVLPPASGMTLSAGTSISGNSLNNPYGAITVGDTIWVPNFGNNTISVFDFSGNAVTTHTGNGLNGPDIPTYLNGRVWVPNFTSSTISVFMEDGTPANTQNSPFASPLTVSTVYEPNALLAVNSTIWSFNDNGTITIINEDGTEHAHITSGGMTYPYGGAIVNDTVWVIDNGSNKITVFSLDGTYTGTTITGNWSGNGTAIYNTGSYIWIGGSNNTLSPYYPNGTPVQSPITGFSMNYPGGIVSINSSLWVVNSNSNVISVIDILSQLLALSPASAQTAYPSTSGALTVGSTSTLSTLVSGSAYVNGALTLNGTTTAANVLPTGSSMVYTTPYGRQTLGLYTIFL